MSVFESLRFWRKANPVANLIVLDLGLSGQPLSPKHNHATQARDGYERNVTVFDCVNLISRACAGIPWVLMQRGATPTSKTKKLMTLGTAAKAWHSGHPMKQRAARQSEIEDHRLLLMLERPHPGTGGAEYTEQVFGFLLISGNSYETYVAPETGPNTGVPLELWALRPDRVRIIPANGQIGELVAVYQYMPGGGSGVTLDRELILHQKFFSPLDDFYGLSPIQVAARVIDGDNAAVLWNQKILDNEGRPSGLVIIKTPLQDDARERFKAELEQRLTGPKNARRPMVGEGDIEWKQLSLTSTDLDWLEGRKNNRREIARAYNVPPELIGDTEVQGYASKEQARKGFYQETCLPLMDRRRDNLNNWLTPRFGDGLYLDYDRDQIEALYDDAAKVYAYLRQADWLSLNEKRDASGYDAYVGSMEQDAPADVPTALVKPAMPVGLVPGLEPAAPLPPAPGAKAQDLSEDQRAIEARLQTRLDRHFRSQAKALSAYVKRGLRATE